jgi:hypothetical protein
VTQGLEEFQTIHYGHVPIKQNDSGHAQQALLESNLAILGLVNLETKTGEQLPRDSPHRDRIVGYQA